MTRIKTEKQYEKALEKVDELLRHVDNQTSENDKNFIALDLLQTWLLNTKKNISRW